MCPVLPRGRAIVKVALPRVSPRGSKFLDTKAEQLQRRGFKRPLSGRSGVGVRGTNWFGGLL